jgi:lipoate-protein ligase A
MRLLDISFRVPEENLAFDEALLDSAENGAGGESLRFWESRVPFVVIGVAQVLRQNVNVKACETDRIPVLRRCSAGGCVLQGPGCLNYTLVLSHALRPEIETIRGSYLYILGHIAETFAARGLAVRHLGVSDLALNGKKVSGNAQKRRRRHILHHGTLLHGMDLEPMEKYILDPDDKDRPKYRGERTHRGFVRNLDLNSRELREIVRQAFGVQDTVENPHPRELRHATELAEEKYAEPDWIYRR